MSDGVTRVEVRQAVLGDLRKAFIDLAVGRDDTALAVSVCGYTEEELVDTAAKIAITSLAVDANEAREARQANGGES